PTIHASHTTSPPLPYTTLFRSERREEPFPVTGESECLQSKRRKRGVTPEHADHKKLTETRTRPNATVGAGECGKKTDNERATDVDRKSTRLNSSHVSISYAVFC